MCNLTWIWTKFLLQMKIRLLIKAGTNSSKIPVLKITTSREIWCRRQCRTDFTIRKRVWEAKRLVPVCSRLAIVDTRWTRLSIWVQVLDRPKTSFEKALAMEEHPRNSWCSLNSNRTARFPYVLSIESLLRLQLSEGEAHKASSIRNPICTHTRNSCMSLKSLPSRFRWT